LIEECVRADSISALLQQYDEMNEGNHKGLPLLRTRIGINSTHRNCILLNAPLVFMSILSAFTLLLMAMAALHDC